MILTLALDPDSFSRLEPLRQRHFPSESNFLSAHLTLFQQLPDDAPTLHRILATIAADTAPLPFTADRILDFGKGAAINLDMPGFRPLHDRLRAAWTAILTESDRRDRRPHVTVQNKVDRATAQATLADLRDGFAPWRGMADSLLLWHYRGGPWEAAGAWPLNGEDATPPRA